MKKIVLVMVLLLLLSTTIQGQRKRNWSLSLLAYGQSASHKGQSSSLKQGIPDFLANYQQANAAIIKEKAKNIGQFEYGINGYDVGLRLDFGGNQSLAFLDLNYSANKSTDKVVFTNGGARTFQFSFNGIELTGGQLIGSKVKKSNIGIFLGVAIGKEKMATAQTGNAETATRIKNLDGTYTALGNYLSTGVFGFIGLDKKDFAKIHYRAYYRYPGLKYDLKDKSKEYFTQRIGVNYQSWDQSPINYQEKYTQGGLRQLGLEAGLLVRLTSEKVKPLTEKKATAKSNRKAKRTNQLASRFNFSAQLFTTAANFESKSYKRFAEFYNADGGNTLSEKLKGKGAYATGFGIGGRFRFGSGFADLSYTQYRSKDVAKVIDGGSRNFDILLNGIQLDVGFLIGGEAKSIGLFTGSIFGTEKLKISHTPGSQPNIYNTKMNGTYKSINGGGFTVGAVGNISLSKKLPIRITGKVMYLIPYAPQWLEDDSKPDVFTKRIGEEYALWRTNPVYYNRDYVRGGFHGLLFNAGINVRLGYVKAKKW